MGNCVFSAYNLGAISTSGDEEQIEEMIKVVTSTGAIMELYAPITAECITNEFPGHALFPSTESYNQDHQQRPLLHNEQLCAGKVYYLLPLTSAATSDEVQPHVVTSTPYRMSTLNNCYGSQRDVGRWTTTNKYRWSPGSKTKSNNSTILDDQYSGDVYPRYNGSGVWKVRLVINPEQLAEILSHDNTTEELIDSVRTVAKCGTAINSSRATSAASSDLGQCSVSSCRY